MLLAQQLYNPNVFLFWQAFAKESETDKPDFYINKVMNIVLGTGNLRSDHFGTHAATFFSSEIPLTQVFLHLSVPIHWIICGHDSSTHRQFWFPFFSFFPQMGNILFHCKAASIDSLSLSWLHSFIFPSSSQRYWQHTSLILMWLRTEMVYMFICI